MTEIKIPVGVSSCVLGNPVRYDGGNKHDKFVSQILSNYFSYQPICPEMAIGMGTQRPIVRHKDAREHALFLFRSAKNTFDDKLEA